MNDKLVDFLGEVDKSDALQQKFSADPQGTAESFGLEAEDIAILTSNNVAMMQERAGGNSGSTQSTDVFR
jgi:hypothetical protein